MSLSLIKSWVFDLDNTLYDPEEDIFSQIDKKMTSFISKRFDINTNDAFNIQKEYFLEYGTTLAGLMNDKNSNIDPDEFLEYVHNIDLKSLNPNLELKKAINNLIGPKFIFTNGTKYHAENVIRKLDLENVFEFIFDIKAANYIPKPNIETYDSFFESTGINPKTSIMFEDMGRNLIPAKDLGMTTVLIKRIVKKNKIILVGSSMGSWISLNQFKYFKNQIVGFVGIGSAPEFLERLMWKKFPKKNKNEIITKGLSVIKNGQYEYPITFQLIKDGRKNKILSKKIRSRIKVTMVHGSKDEVVPVSFSRKVLSVFPNAQRKLVVIKNGDHSLSNQVPLKKIIKELKSVVKDII